MNHDHLRPGERADIVDGLAVVECDEPLGCSEQSNMPNCAELADYDWLTGTQAAVILRDLADQREPLVRSTSRLRRQFSATRTHLLLEQIELRERAAAKFPNAGSMFFTRRGLEQATDGWVAAYKARRFAGHGPLADLCCGIGGDLLALAKFERVVGIDSDPIAACLAAANARSVLKDANANRISLSTCDARDLDVCVVASWHIDPDRRRSGKRTSSLERSDPDRSVIERTLSAVPHAAIKLAPAADVPSCWTESCDLEWISRDRQCRQLVAWHGDLAAAPGRRRATVLTNDGQTARTLIGLPDERVPVAERLERFLFEPDAAVLAAHLTGTLANKHGLAAISPGIAYLTGPAVIHDAALACFAVDDVLPLDLRRLSRHLRSRSIGQLEIKTRGVEHSPEDVRRMLKPRGDGTATLMLTRLNGKPAAIFALRVQPGDSLSPLNTEP